MSPMVRRGPELMEQREYEKPQPTRKRRGNVKRFRLAVSAAIASMAIAAHADAQALAQVPGPSGAGGRVRYA